MFNVQDTKSVMASEMMHHEDEFVGNKDLVKITEGIIMDEAPKNCEVKMKNELQSDDEDLAGNGDYFEYEKVCNTI